jgi:hypothetical protein
MNQRPQGLKVEKAMAGFLQYKSAEGLAPVTVTGYERDLKLWIEYIALAISIVGVYNWRD